MGETNEDGTRQRERDQLCIWLLPIFSRSTFHLRRQFYETDIVQDSIAPPVFHTGAGNPATAPVIRPRRRPCARAWQLAPLLVPEVRWHLDDFGSVITTAACITSSLADIWLAFTVERKRGNGPFGSTPYSFLLVWRGLTLTSFICWFISGYGDCIIQSEGPCRQPNPATKQGFQGKEYDNAKASVNMMHICILHFT